MNIDPGSLENIFLSHTGKVSDKWDIYIKEYSQIFYPYRDKPVGILEIGIQNGGSLEIWDRYFKNYNYILGVDINNACKALQFETNKISIIVADINTQETEYLILEKFNSFEIIIDDGSHTSGDIIKSFCRYFKHLSDGGIYIIEDMHCSYRKNFGGGVNEGYSAISFLKLLIDAINYEHWESTEPRGQILDSFATHYNITIDEEPITHIYSIEFINSLCIIKKKTPNNNTLGKRIISGEIADVWDGALLLKNKNKTE